MIYLRAKRFALSSWLLALSIAGYPIAGLLAAAMDWQSRWTSVPFRIGTALLAISIIVISCRKCLFSYWSWALIIFLSLYSLRLIHSIVSSYPSAEYELQFFIIAVILPVIAMLCSNFKHVEKNTLIPLLWLTGLVGTLAVFGEVLNLFHANSMTFTGRLSTITVNPITLGHISVTLLIATIAWTIKTPQLQQWLIILLSALGIIVLSLAGSRGPFLAILAALTGILAAHVIKNNWSSVKYLVLMIMLVLLIFWRPIPMNNLISQSYWELQYTLLPNQDEKKRQELEKILLTKQAQIDAYEYSSRTSLTGNSTQLRILMWKKSLNTIKHYPWIGKSNKEVYSNGYPHNLILEAFQNLGIFGGTMFIVLLAKGIHRAWQQLKLNNMLIPMLFIQALVACQFSGSLFSQVQLWTTLALLLSLNTVKTAGRN